MSDHSWEAQLQWFVVLQVSQLTSCFYYFEIQSNVSTINMRLLNIMGYVFLSSACANEIYLKLAQFSLGKFHMCHFCRLIWRALFSWNTRFEIHPFALLLTIWFNCFLKPISAQYFLFAPLLEFAIQINLEHDTIAVWTLPRS